MSNVVLIIGESGTGKSTSIRNLNPEETAIINVINKKLPFGQSAKKYNVENKNYVATDDYNRVIKCIELIEKRQEIKNLVIDDFQFIMINEFMRRATERGFDKFTEIAQHTWLVLDACNKVSRDDLDIFILSHSEIKEGGISKPKTVGKLVDEKGGIETKVTTVLHTMVIDGSYKFLTNHEPGYCSKSPMGAFEEKLIDNDLVYVKEKLSALYGDQT